MVDQTNVTAIPPVSTTLSDRELQALAYFAMGVGSESALGGKNVAYDLRFAGNINDETRVMSPVGNSGYSLGTIQTDLGQHPENVPGMIDAYQAWVQENAAERPGWKLTEQQRTQTIADLGRTGNAIKGANKESIIDNGLDLDATIKSRIKTFLASDAGITYTHSRDVAQIDNLMRKGDVLHPAALEQLQSTSLYQSSTIDDQAKLAAIFLKLENQSGRAYFPKIIDAIENGALNTFDQVKQEAQNRKPEYVKTGVEHALEGTKVFNALRNANEQSPLHQTWQKVLADPLVNPTQLHTQSVANQIPPPISPEIAGGPGFGVHLMQQVSGISDSPILGSAVSASSASEYATVKTLFLKMETSPQLIEALDRGGTYGHNVVSHQGRTVPQSTSLYAAGNDFVVMDGNGIGKAYIGGVWSDVNRANLTRVNNADGGVNLNITENGAQRLLLHVDPNAPALRPTPTQAPIDQNHPVQQQQGILRNGPPAQEEPGAQDPRRETRSTQQEHQSNPLNIGPPLGQPRAELDPRDRNHPDHALYQQALAGVHLHDAALGRAPDENSERMVASLTALAKENGIRQIDHVAFSVNNGRDVKAGENVFIVQGQMGSSTADRAHMKTDVAVNTSVQSSFQQLESINQKQAQEVITQQQSRQQTAQQASDGYHVRAMS